MRRWLAALKVIKEIEELSGTPIEDNERSNEQQYPSEGPTESSRKQSMVNKQLNTLDALDFNCALMYTKNQLFD